NWDVFELESSKTYYLRNEKRWLKASDINGPWSSATTPPDSLSKLPDDGNWTEVKAALPRPSAAAADPSVFVSTQPAELILLRRQRRQGHHQSRRPLLHVLPGCLVHGPLAEGAVGSRVVGARRDLRDSRELARAQRDLRHGREQRRRRGDVRGRRRLHRHDG